MMPADVASVMAISMTYAAMPVVSHSMDIRIFEYVRNRETFSVEVHAPYFGAQTLGAMIILSDSRTKDRDCIARIFCGKP